MSTETIIEAMVSEVQKCLNGFTFSGKCLQCFRGIWPDQFIFNNEQRKIFLDLSKEHKLLAPSSIEEYKPVMNSLFQCSINGIVYIYYIYIYLSDPQIFLYEWCNWKIFST